MQLVWPRCPKCGRRWRAEHPACGTQVGSLPGKAIDAGPMPPIEGLIADKLLGAGGFGQVYLARVASDGGRVAVKIPNADPDAIMRLELEGETLRLLGGVHAPALYDRPVLEDGRPALVMEFVPMPLLSERLAELPDGMPLDELGRRALSILNGLKAVHALSLVHRDLKPENIFSTDGPPVTRIFDFGLVKTPAEANEPHTTMGLMMGTPEYMAPEQLDSSAPVDQRADIYAIGAVLYEMLCGRPPFWGNAAEVQQALAARRAARPSRYVASAPPALEDVILRCLAKDPVRRFASTEELYAAFEAALTQAVPARIVPASTPEAKPAQTASTRRPMAVLAVNGITVDALSKALASGGGQLAEVGRNGGVGVFGEKTSENPVRRAIRLADALLARKACRNVTVDLASVVVRKKPDGGERYVSAAFARLQKQLEALPRDGLFLTDAAAELLPDRRGEGLPEGGLTAALPPPKEEEALTVVRSSQAPLVGRTEELQRLSEALRAAIAGRRAGLATIIGDGGMGKSHLGAALIEELRAARTEAAVVELRIREPIDGEGESNLRALLGRCFTLPADKPADGGEALLGGLGPSLWPVAAMTLGWLAPDAPELRSLSAAPGVLRAMVSRAVGEALRLRARERPLAVILDDAHLADDATLEAIEYATMPEAAAPISICAAARPALAQMKPSWGERSADHLRIELGPLAPEAGKELTRRLLYPVEHVPGSALETLVAGTQGSPFLITELVRGLKRDGIVRRDASNGVWFLATDELAKLPDLAVTDWLAEREIGTLTPELAEHARLSALLGADFSEDEVDGILSELERAQAGAGQGDGALQMDPHIATRQLVTMGVFKRQRGGRTAFRHSLLRSAVEKSVSDRMRADVHAAAFRFYQAATALEDPVRLPRLAFHAASAGRADAAAPVYLELAERARSRHAYVEAEALYSRALGQLPETALSQRVSALRGRGLMRYRLSRHDSVDDLMAALAGVRALNDRTAEIDIILEAATAYDWMVEYRKSRELVNEASALVGASGPDSDLLRASLLAGEGRALWRFSEGRQAIDKFRQANAIAERLGDAGYEIRVLSLLLLGDLLPFNGQLAEAEKISETVIALCEAHGDQAHLMVAVANRRQLWMGRGDVDRAVIDTKRSIQIAREIGFVAGCFMGEYNLGELLYQAGDAAAAEDHVRRAVDLEQKRLSGIPRPVAELLEARVLAFLGRNADARARYDRIAAVQAEAEQTGQSEKLLLPNERVLLALVDLCTRDASPEECQALRLRADADSIESELIEVVEMMGLSALRRGRTEFGRAQLDEARRLAERIPNVMGNRLRREPGAEAVARVS